MLGTAGHVDHGKTALVKLLTGCETDTLAEEKQRGLTIDLGFAPCRLADDRIVGVVDVPGHVDFIRNMVAGAHGVDVVILVVAADDGIMPQTHEHLHILTLMGLRYGVVALTKIDLVERSRREQVVAELKQLLAGTFLETAPICPMCNITGEGFEGFFDALNEVVGACGERNSGGLFRLWVEDVFTLKGPGTVVTGIPSSGSVNIGDKLELLPGNRTAHVRRMQVYGQDATLARAGECVAMNLPDFSHTELRRGMLLCTPGVLLPVSMAEAELQVLDSVSQPVEDFIEVHLHVGTAAVQARVAMLEATNMCAGQKQMVQFRLAEPLPLTPGERFVIRANLGGPDRGGLVTIGGGRILGLTNARLRRKRPWTVESLRARRDALEDPIAWCALMLREARGPLTRPELEHRCFRPTAELQPTLERLRAENRLVGLPDGSLVHPGFIEEIAGRVLQALHSFHVQNPQRAGMTGEELFTAGKTTPDLCELAAQALLSRKTIELRGTVYAQAGWAPRLADPDQRLCQQIGDAFQAARWAPPAPPELALALKQPAARVEKLLGLLADKAVLVRLDPRTFIHRDALESAKGEALRLFARKKSFSTMEFRDALGVSRKYAVPLLDYLDKIRFTVRNGHDRTPGVEAKKLL